VRAFAQKERQLRRREPRAVAARGPRLQQAADRQVVRRALDDGPLRTPRDAPDCPGYENSAEVRKSYTEAGHLGIDVFTFPTGSDNLLVADYGIDWGSPKDSTRSDPILQANLGVFERDASHRWTIRGYSDCVGNERDTYLRWRRAKKLYNLLTPAARARATIEVAPLGEFVQPNDTAEHRAMNRGVVIKRSTTKAPVPEAPPDHVCGPDATKWFLDQVDAGKKDGDVLRVKGNLAIARSLLAGLNLSSDLIAIGMVAQRVREARLAAGSPAFKGKAEEQLLNSFSGAMAVAQAEEAAKHMDTLQLIQFGRAADLLKNAALTWKALVATGARYDFKNSASTLQNPRSDNCPKSCNSTVTLAGMCLLKDVPGNLFFAHIGRFVGWQELTLQLGSQWAQLLASKDWDPPEDTALITLGFNLPEPLTEQGLRDALAGGATDFSRQCSICREPLRADIV
jgi:hypothetical protein